MVDKQKEKQEAYFAMRQRAKEEQPFITGYEMVVEFQDGTNSNMQVDNDGMSKERLTDHYLGYLQDENVKSIRVYRSHAIEGRSQINFHKITMLYVKRFLSFGDRDPLRAPEALVELMKLLECTKEKADQWYQEDPFTPNEGQLPEAEAEILKTYVCEATPIAGKRVKGYEMVVEFVDQGHRRIEISNDKQNKWYLTNLYLQLLADHALKSIRVFEIRKDDEKFELLFHPLARIHLRTLKTNGTLIPNDAFELLEMTSKKANDWYKANVV